MKTRAPAPVVFIVRAGVDGSAVRVESTVDDPKWLDSLKMQVADVFGRSIKSPAEAEFRLSDGRSLSTLPTSANLARVGRLNFFINDVKVRSAKPLIIPDALSANKPAKLAGWAERALEDLPEKLAIHLADHSSTPVSLRKALAPNGSAQQLISAHVSSSLPNWPEFVATHNASGRGSPQEISALISSRLLEAIRARVGPASQSFFPSTGSLLLDDENTQDAARVDTYPALLTMSEQALSSRDILKTISSAVYSGPSLPLIIECGWEESRQLSKGIRPAGSDTPPDMTTSEEAEQTLWKSLGAARGSPESEEKEASIKFFEAELAFYRADDALRQVDWTDKQLLAKSVRDIIVAMKWYPKDRNMPNGVTQVESCYATLMSSGIESRWAVAKTVSDIAHKRFPSKEDVDFSGDPRTHKKADEDALAAAKNGKEVAFLKAKRAAWQELLPILAKPENGGKLSKEQVQDALKKIAASFKPVSNDLLKLNTLVDKSAKSQDYSDKGLDMIVDWLNQSPTTPLKDIEQKREVGKDKEELYVTPMDTIDVGRRRLVKFLKAGAFFEAVDLANSLSYAIVSCFTSADVIPAERNEVLQYFATNLRVSDINDFYQGYLENSNTAFLMTLYIVGHANNITFFPLGKTGVQLDPIQQGYNAVISELNASKTSIRGPFGLILLGIIANYEPSNLTVDSTVKFNSLIVAEANRDRLGNKDFIEFVTKAADLVKDQAQKLECVCACTLAMSIILDAENKIPMYFGVLVDRKALGVALELEPMDVTVRTLSALLAVYDSSGAIPTDETTFSRLLVGPTLIKSETIGQQQQQQHHPWNAQIHHTLRPIAGAFPAYYENLHTSRNMTRSAPFAGNVLATYRAYSTFSGLPLPVSLAPVRSKLSPVRSVVVSKPLVASKLSNIGAESVVSGASAPVPKLSKIAAALPSQPQKSVETQMPKFFKLSQLGAEFTPKIEPTLSKQTQKSVETQMPQLVKLSQIGAEFASQAEKPLSLPPPKRASAQMPQLVKLSQIDAELAPKPESIGAKVSAPMPQLVKLSQIGAEFTPRESIGAEVSAKMPQLVKLSQIGAEFQSTRLEQTANFGGGGPSKSRFGGLPTCDDIFG